jgi:hypothetical protein
MEIRIHATKRPTFDKSRTMRIIRITCGEQGFRVRSLGRRPRLLVIHATPRRTVDALSVRRFAGRDWRRERSLVTISPALSPCLKPSNQMNKGQ